jgi:hypothetical protein
MKYDEAVKSIWRHSESVPSATGAVDYKSTGLDLRIPEVTELNEQRWWAWKDSNLRPMDYETRLASLVLH